MDKEIVIPISKIKTLPSEHSMVEEVADMSVSNDGKIVVNFAKFIQLLYSHDFEEIIESHKDEEIVISSSLLLDLASTTPLVDDEISYKLPTIVFGIVLGLVIGFIVFLFFLK